MTTRALDVVTIGHAFSVLDGVLKTTGWRPKNPQQEWFFEWYGKNREKIARIKGLEALASQYYEKLNEFLVAHKFDPMVEPFDPDLGLGVVSILDKLVQWRNGPGALVDIRGTSGAMLPGFELPRNGVNIFEVAGYPGSYLLELLTQSDDTLWLFVHGDTSLDGLDLVRLSLDVMSQSRKTPMSTGFHARSSGYPTFAGAQIPMLDFNIKPKLDWLLDADTHTAAGEYYFVTQAAQQFKMRMDETGARVKVATVIVTMRGMSEEPRVFVVNGPVYGWWTQKGFEDLPMAAFFADLDALHKPAGSLAEL